MKMLGQRYVQYVNRTYRRSSTLWEGRFRSCLLQEDGYLLECHRYIELNPVHGDGRASGHVSLEQLSDQCTGASRAFLKPHPLYAALRRDPAERRAAYRELFRYQLDPGLVDELRSATNGNYALGNERFLQEMVVALGRRVTRGKAGRPSGQADGLSAELFG